MAKRIGTYTRASMIPSPPPVGIPEPTPARHRDQRPARHSAVTSGSASFLEVVTVAETVAEIKRRAASVRHSPETYARSIARRWADLDTDTRTRVRDLLTPVLGGGR